MESREAVGALADACCRAAVRYPPATSHASFPFTSHAPKLPIAQELQAASSLDSLREAEEVLADMVRGTADTRGRRRGPTHPHPRASFWSSCRGRRRLWRRWWTGEPSQAHPCRRWTAFAATESVRCATNPSACAARSTRRRRRCPPNGHSIPTPARSEAVLGACANAAAKELLTKHLSLSGLADGDERARTLALAAMQTEPWRSADPDAHMAALEQLCGDRKRG